MAPAWFTSSLGLLETNEPPLGECWLELVRLWAAFEEKEDFVEQRRLGMKACPAFVAEWIQNTCSPTWRPTTVNIPALEKSFQAWWKGLQLAWRISGDGLTVLKKVDGNWDDLRRPRLNRILSVLACLFFWGCKAQGNTKHCTGWASAMEDCILVLGQL
jgi:hypothetical protein